MVPAELDHFMSCKTLTKLQGEHKEGTDGVCNYYICYGDDGIVMPVHSVCLDTCIESTTSSNVCIGSRTSNR